MVETKIESIYIKDITKGTLTLSRTWLQAIIQTRNQGQLPNSREITTSFVKRVGYIFPVPLVLPLVFRTCPGDITLAMVSTGIKLVVYKNPENAYIQDVERLSLTDELSDKDKDKPKNKMELSILDLVNEGSALHRGSSESSSASEASVSAMGGT